VHAVYGSVRRIRNMSSSYNLHYIHHAERAVYILLLSCLVCLFPACVVYALVDAVVCEATDLECNETPPKRDKHENHDFADCGRHQLHQGHDAPSATCLSKHRLV
jgi:hypothetical protein